MYIYGVGSLARCVLVFGISVFFCPVFVPSLYLSQIFLSLYYLLTPPPILFSIFLPRLLSLPLSLSACVVYLAWGARKVL